MVLLKRQMKVIMETLLDNEIVFSRGNVINNSPMLKEYIDKYPLSNNMTIYKDNITNVLFSKAEHSLMNTRDDFSFLDSQENWLNGVQGIQRIQQQNAGLDEGANRMWHKQGEIIQNPEVVLSVNDKSKVEQYNNKSCLIVGAGPSTNLINWRNVDVDYKITMNQFYLNKDMLETKFDIICPGGRVDFNNVEFKRYIREYKPQIFLEPYFIKKNIQWFINKHFNDIMFFVTRYCSKLGTAPRLIALSILLGFKDIYFVGFDGYSKDMKAKHSFDGVDGAKDINDYDLFRRQYTIFYDYILNDLIKIYPNVRLYNLGEGTPENMSTEITSKFIPLNNNIKKLIQK